MPTNTSKDKQQKRVSDKLNNAFICNCPDPCDCVFCKFEKKQILKVIRKKV